MTTTTGIEVRLIVWIKKIPARGLKLGVTEREEDAGAAVWIKKIPARGLKLLHILPTVRQLLRSGSKKSPPGD